jgi:hypothetical protein
VDTDTPDAKTRIKTIDKDFPARFSPKPHRNHQSTAKHAESGFKISFSPSIAPRGGVVPNLIKKDRNGHPYVNFIATPESLNLPGYAPDNEIFYAHRDGGSKRPFKKHPKSNHRNHSKTGESGSPGQTGKVVAGPSRQDKK